MRTTTFSVLDYLPASVREFPKRRAAEMLGIALLAGVATLGLALLTWSVADPSLNHATNAPVHNLLGVPGAIAADMVMQMLGLGCVAVLAPPAFWGWRLLTARRLQHPRLKIGLYLLGVAATSALASLLPAPGSWPLPTGLGGVVGDALLALPRRLASGSTWGLAASGAAFAAIAILALAAAAGVGFARHPHADDGPEVAKNARNQAQARFDDEEAEDGPGFGMVAIGAAIHALLTAKAALRRLFRRRPKPAFAGATALPQPLQGDSRAPWMALRADEEPLTKPADYAPRAKGIACGVSRPGFAARRASGRTAEAGRACPGEIRLHAARRLDHAVDCRCSPSRRSRRRQDLRMTRWSRTRACSKACSTISASRARSSTSAPVRS